MKNKFLNYSTELLKKHYPEIDDIKMEEYKYSLEGFYLTITKLLFIIPLAIILGQIKELILLLIIFNYIREPAHGLHATKSWICLLSSTLIFIGIPIVSKLIIVPFIVQIILGIAGIILIFIYSPADTEKAPIIKKKRRKKLKIISTINCIILTILYLLIKNIVITNLIILSIWLEIILIHPLTYKLFKLSYNNYKMYLLNMN